jgi:hypothetical protein
MAWSFFSQVDVMSTTKLGAPSIVSPVAMAYRSLSGRNADPRSGR